MQLFCFRLGTWTPVPQVLLGAYSRSRLTDSIGCLLCTHSCHKALPPELHSGISTFWRFCSPSSEGAEFSASLRSKCGNHTLLQLVSFHCISISGCCSLLLDRAGLAVLRTALGKGMCWLLCWGCLLEHTRRDVPPICPCGYAGV